MNQKNPAYGRRPWHLQVMLRLAALVLALGPALPAFAADRLILAFGDSLTAGYGLAPAQAFPNRLEAALRAGGVPARVHNGGVSGDTAAAGRARLNWLLRGLKAKPDLAIVELGANDMLRGLQPAQTRINLDAILSELRRRRIPVLLTGMRAAPNLGRPYAAAFEPIFPALARKYDARLYPFFLEGVAGNPALLQGDGMHPNPRGVAIIVRRILPMVRASLPR